jgi:prolyl-tRNA synthetase
LSAAPSPLTAWPPDGRTLHEIGLVDARYPVTGASMWLPHGFALASHVIALFAAELDSRGFERVALPPVVPAAVLDRQRAGGLGDFRGRVFFASSPHWRDEMVLAPTIEGQISSIWADWLGRGMAAPPLRMWSARSVARYEPNVPRPMWNERFVWPFVEAQTGTLEPVDGDVVALMAASERVCRSAGLPVLMVERVGRPGFSPGYASRRFELVTVMPSGAVSTLSSVYDLATRFSEAFGVRVDGQPLRMVNFACSSRLLLSVVGHSLAADGMPAYHPRIAPVQVAVVAERRQHADRAARLAATLRDLGIRARACPGGSGATSQVRWAARHGAPILLRTTLGRLTMQVRPPGSEREASLDEVALGGTIREALADLMTARERRCAAAATGMVTARTSADGIRSSGGMSSALVCGAERCLLRMLDHVDLDVVGRSWPGGASIPDAAGACILCGDPASQRLLVGRKMTGEK